MLEVCRRWEVRATVIGRVTGTGRLRILDGWDGAVLADVPAATLHEDAPLYQRPMAPPADLAARQAGDDPARLPGPPDCGADLLALLVDPSWVYRQYDHQLFLNTVVAPGGDAALLRLAAPGRARAAPERRRGRPGLALSTDGNARWCALDPRAGTALVVAESTLNVACVGARPVALVNCLNFGNPEHPEVMWQLSEAIDGMAEACRGLSIPVIGGNVSLYNESRGRDIDPTPVVGTLGLVDASSAGRPGLGLAAGSHILLVGAGLPGAAPACGDPSPWLAAGGPGTSRPPGGRLPDWIWTSTAACSRWCRTSSATTSSSTGCTTSPTAAWAWPWPRWRCAAGWASGCGGIADHRGALREGPSRVLVCVPDPDLDQVLDPAALPPVSGGADLGVGRRRPPGRRGLAGPRRWREAWRDCLPRRRPAGRARARPWPHAESPAAGQL